MSARSLVRPLVAIAVLVSAADVLLPHVPMAAHGAAPRTAPRFYDDDPIARAADTQDASKVEPREISLLLDSVVNLFGRPGLQDVGRAEDVNTIDEVPDSSWFTNRAGSRSITPRKCFAGRMMTPAPQPAS